MRIAIREQLAALVISAVLVALAIVAIPTWIYVNNFVVRVESDGLSLTASLKASRIASEIDLVKTICQTVATRILLQQAFIDFYNANSTVNPFINARSDLESAMGAGRVAGLLQARLYPRNTTGSPTGLLNVTGSGVPDQGIELPYLRSNGSRVYLGDPDDGFPPSLYPNLTYEGLGYPNPYVPSTPAFVANAFPGVRLNDNVGLLLGPLIVNESFALISLTIPIKSLTIDGFILGYMTLVASAKSFVGVQTTREGLGSTGMALLIGPGNPSNRFNTSLPASNGTYSPPRGPFARSSARFVLPPIAAQGQPDRHSSRGYGDGGFRRQFTLSEYPGLFDVYYQNNSRPNNATAFLSTTNEQGIPVAVGVARPQSTLVDWAVVVEQARSEAYEPIRTLRTILLACVFGTAGLVVLLVCPCAHLSVRPISRLKAATEKSIAPPGYEDEYDDNLEDGSPGSGGTLSQGSKKGIIANIRRSIKKRQRAKATAEADAEARRHIFKIPGRVEDRKHYITDELTELTQTFNEMTDELLKQYTSLDDKVAERTRELELSKKAAEAANESKTLFIANLSHELKTPLNGIMGMCAICMEEESIVRIKQSLKTLYKSALGDLLLHLLEDLLSFSKNQIGQHVSLEEKVFRLGDIRSQMLSIFDKQVRESKITFTVALPTSDNSEPEGGLPGTSRLQDMCLWGDQHRILQVIINLVSNSLKFTPAGGRVELRIRERMPTPPPPNAKTYTFEFQVEDTGLGIPEPMQKKIFEPFVQGDLGLSKKFGGAGLGLSICAQLAQLMGGSIGVNSTLGVGSVFTMQIPLNRPASIASSAASHFHRNSFEQNANNTSSVLEDEQPRLVGLSAPFFAANPNPPPLASKKEQTAAIDKAMANKGSGQGRLRVLVADDNSTNVEVVSRMLKLEDVYDVTIATDGQEAYELVKANMDKDRNFDVIFMDVQMPNLDGLQSTRLIRKMGYAAPIVALTAFSEESNVKECMESGMDEFLSKPIRRPALKKVLTKFATIPEEAAETTKATLYRRPLAVNPSS
ncbi:response regulator receiver domain-containing protein [Hirsutella rhossiliensis]|uniref:histidine kinase n=1 Tax=Hirsutella rhossiliensis TaxID=111463 RepID=A0A9P8MTN4_9HYPO|nr:response regulator receiver domain-containing protein [Hirsutella rhossiliensis]KAH0961035.1 response regulator receiver domain-containing protein [Hirsutella rhossiliensis]